MNTSYLAKENLIFKTSATDEKIYIREQNGVFQRIRRYLSWVLIGLFIIFPFLQYQGNQAVLFDLQLQQLHFFAFTLFPRDMLIFSLIFMLAAFLLFYITKFYGRVWCGFTCPQTVWMLMFNWIERRVEGSHNHSKALDKSKLTATKLFKKSIKHFLWVATSLLTALVFISYFVPVEQLYKPFFTFDASSLVVSWVVFFAACTYINAGWIREKMCQHMCPYSRFQSAMFDNTTKLVTYDSARGENRGKRKRNAKPSAKNEELGDCVDCNLCVQVCPVGIDIREGLQYECINCGLCVDACDQTMDKFNYDRKLISFTSQEINQSNWKRHLGYGSVVTALVLSIIIWGQTWNNFEVSVIRDRQALYRVNDQGKIENTYTIKIRNKTSQVQNYSLAIDGIKQARILGAPSIKVLPRELATSSISVVSELALNEKRSDIRFTIKDIQSETSIEKNTSFYSGSGGW